MTSPTYDFNNLRTLLDRAGISIAEAATLFKTSRPTLYSWCAGNAPTQGLLLSNAERLIRVIERAVEAKDLPVVDLEKEKRLPAITAELRKHLNA